MQVGCLVGQDDRGLKYLFTYELLCVLLVCYSPAIGYIQKKSRFGAKKVEGLRKSQIEFLKI